MGECDRRRPTPFVRDGFVVLDRFLDGDEVAAIRPAVDALAASPPDPACSRPHNTLLPLRWNDRIVQLLLASPRRIQVLREALGADDLRWISGYVSIKEARSPALWWHQDWWCWDHGVSYRRAAPQVAVLCYLTATDARNGALRVLPGSHQRSLRIHACLPEPHAHAANDLGPGHAAMRDHPGQVTPRLGAGDAVAIDYRLLHGTHPNAGDARRDCILLSFTPSWRGLPADIQGHLIGHPAQPAAGERPPAASWEAAVLPRFGGVPKSLQVNRIAPRKFEVTD
jgi:ectoine hydroxylase-related dioxygenase (phytanoyl-CoA dioxygenase family)